MSDFLKIVGVEIKNFQTLEQKRLDIGGKSIAIIGKNGGGKSSMLRAIQSPLNSQFIPLKPIKDGEERGYVKVELEGVNGGEPAEFTYHIVFNQKAKRGKLKVTDKDGSEIPSRDIYNQLIGNISFDIDEFIRLGMTSTGKISKPGIQEQIEMFMSFLTKEERQEIRRIEAMYDKIEEQRKVDKKEISRLKTLIADNKMEEAEMNKFSVDRSKEKLEVERKMQNLSEAIKEYNAKVSKKQELDSYISQMTEKYKDAKAIIEMNKAHDLVILGGKLGTFGFDKAKEELTKVIEFITEYNAAQKQAKEIIKERSEIENWLNENTEPDITSLNEKLNEINEHQRMFEKIKEIKADWMKVQDLEKKSAKATDDLKSLKEAKKSVFSNSKLPIKDLELDEKDGILYKGLPLNQDHHPTSLILSIGAKIAMGLNPNLKCIFIKDGSMFDQKTLKWLLKEVEKEGFQLFIEMVDWTGEKEVEVEFTEDYVK